MLRSTTASDSMYQMMMTYNKILLTSSNHVHHYYLQGSGIAMVMANAGIPVTLVETSSELAEAAKQRIESTYKMSSAFKSGKMSEEKLKKTMSYFTFASDLNVLSDADIVVEAVFENMEVKKNIFAQLDKICKSDAILATNTSFMDVDEIASATTRPENVVGTRKLALIVYVLSFQIMLVM